MYCIISHRGDQQFHADRLYEYYLLVASYTICGICNLLTVKGKIANNDLIRDMSKKIERTSNSLLQKVLH